LDLVVLVVAHAHEPGARDALLKERACEKMEKRREGKKKNELLADDVKDL
jgi:hypothetical protein